MAMSYSTGSANARLTACLTATSTSAGQAVDGQSGNGSLIIGTSSLALPSTGVLGTVTLNKPSFSIASKVATISTSPTVSASATGAGTAALAILADSGGNAVISGLSVGTSGSNVNLNSVTIAVAETITVTGGTITHV